MTSTQHRGGAPSRAAGARHAGVGVDLHFIDSQPPNRLHRALFQSIGDDSRAALVEHRLAEAITSGVLPAGDRLPSESELAETFGVAPTTVREALTQLRARGLIVTVRGRRGGSYVDESADPVVFAREALIDATLVGLRDMGVHYGTIAAGCMRLAARRASPEEVHPLVQRLDALGEDDLAAWRRTLDELVTELAALGQSPRLTRDLMQRQLELTPFLRLLDAEADERAAQRAGLHRLFDAVLASDEGAATESCERFVRRTIDGLVSLRSAARR